MNFRPNLRLTVLASALAVMTAGAYATYERGNPTLVPSYAPPAEANAPEARPLVQEVPAVVASEAGIEANEQVVSETQAVTGEPASRHLAPVSEIPAREPITVEQPRLTLDERIQADVMDVIARNPHLSGKIGVVTQDAVVTLTGYTTTSGMAWRAGRDARGIQGVRHVVNEIRPRVGAITS